MFDLKEVQTYSMELESLNKVLLEESSEMIMYHNTTIRLQYKWRLKIEKLTKSYVVNSS